MTFAVVHLTIVFAQDIQRRLDHGRVTDVKGTVIQEISVVQNFLGSVYECLKLASFENSSGVGFQNHPIQLPDNRGCLNLEQ